MIVYTISWLRAYHTRSGYDADALIAQLCREPVQGICEFESSSSKTDTSHGFERLSIVPNDDKYEFFDLQAIRSKAFASGLGSSVEIFLPNQQVFVEARVSVLAHASGFVVIRLTIDLSDIEATAEPQAVIAEVSALERAPWKGRPYRWLVGGHEVETSLRGCQNLLFFIFHERIHGRNPDAKSLCARVAQDNGESRIEELCRNAEMSHPLPVSFGTHIEVCGGLADQASRERQCAELLVDAIDDGSVRQECHADARIWDRPDSAWYLYENQSIVFVDVGEVGKLGVYHAFIVQLLEFNLLRRAALRSVQRDTQRILAQGDGVSRRRIDEWRLLLATTTDDYILHDQISHILLPMVKHMAESDVVRDPELLSVQVEKNIDSFQARIDLASQSVSTIIGALFAVVAAVIGFSALSKAGVAALMDTTVRGLEDEKPWLSSLIDVVVSFIAFGVTWLLIKRAADRLPALRPYQNRSR